MIPADPAASRRFAPGTRVRVVQHVRVGHRRWTTEVVGHRRGRGHPAGRRDGDGGQGASTPPAHPAPPPGRRRDHRRRRRRADTEVDPLDAARGPSRRNAAMILSRLRLHRPPAARGDRLRRWRRWCVVALVAPRKRSRPKARHLRVRRADHGRDLGPVPHPVLHLRPAVRRLRHRDGLPLPLGGQLRRASGCSPWSRWSSSSCCWPSAWPTPGRRGVLQLGLSRLEPAVRRADRWRPRRWTSVIVLALGDCRSLAAWLVEPIRRPRSRAAVVIWVVWLVVGFFGRLPGDRGLHGLGRAQGRRPVPGPDRPEPRRARSACSSRSPTPSS